MHENSISSLFSWEKGVVGTHWIIGSVSANDLQGLILQVLVNIDDSVEGPQSVTNNIETHTASSSIF